MDVPRRNFMAATRLLAVLFFHCEKVGSASKYSLLSDFFVSWLL